MISIVEVFWTGSILLHATPPVVYYPSLTFISICSCFKELCLQDIWTDGR